MRTRLLLVALVTVLGCALLPAGTAAAEPSTPVQYPSTATATRFSGYAFDACTAPRASTMKRWLDSKYRGVGVYIGGPLRACSQRYLTKRWVQRVSAMGWRIIPIYVGLQAPCRNHPRKDKISPKRAFWQGVAAAAAARRQAHRLGMLPGSALYLDLEGYPERRPKCRKAVLRYASGWTTELHRRGYLAGVYSPMGSGAKHFAQAYRSRSLARPDALWVAHWNRKPSLRGWPTVGDRLWPSGQRGKQYRGGHREKHGGRALHVDSNRFDGPVASIARRHRIVGATPVKARHRPHRLARAVDSFRRDTPVPVVCHARGSKVGHSRTWHKLTGGGYVPARNIRPRRARVPRCTYPFQVTAPDRLATRTGPGTRYRKAGSIPHGGLVRITCQTRGQDVFGDRVWDRLSNGRWVSDRYVATGHRRGFTRPIPRC